MAATQASQRRSARSGTQAARQGLRSQMRITKNKHTIASEKATIKQEVKAEVAEELYSTPLSSVADKKPPPAARRKAKKAQHATGTPFPDFARPTPKDCHKAHDILTSLHGERKRPEKVVASRTVAGCGDSPSVLDALVRTILSQNTSSKNSTRAKKSMDETYGGSDQWETIYAGGQPKLQKAIQSGGLAVTKSKVIINILGAVHDKYGKFSLDHMFDASDEDAMNELLSFPGVGPKTASCILLFCLQRPSFAVDTHVYRLTGVMGWRPQEATREQAQAHLDAIVPDDLKYPLHVLLIAHGRTCPACNAKAAAGESCKLREAFE